MHEYVTSPFLQQIYTLVFEPTPNVGGEVIMVLLQNIFSVGIAMKILISLVLLLFCTGTRNMIQLFFNQETWLSLVVPLLAFHLMFLFGFLNYILGFGLFCLTFSYWYPRSVVQAVVSTQVMQRVAIAVLSLACYFSHLSSYAFLGLAISIVLVYELITRSGLFARRLVLALPAGIPMIFFLLFMRGSGTNSGTTYSDLQGKITTFLLMLTSYDKIFDLVLIVLLAACVVIAFIRARKRRFSKVAIAMFVVFAIAFALCPATLFTSQMADARVVPVLFALMLGAVRLELPAKTQKILIGCVLLLLGVRSVLIVTEWVELSSTMHQQLALADSIPERSRVRPLYHYEDVVLDKRERPFRHLLSYKMIDHDLVLASFIGLPGQQPVVFREQPNPVLLDNSIPLTSAGLDSLAIGYDYFWSYRLTPREDSLLASRYRLIGEAEQARLFKLKE